MDYGFEFIINNGGVDTEEDYPYKARDGQCDPNRVRVKLKQNSIFLVVEDFFFALVDFVLHFFYI